MIWRILFRRHAWTAQEYESTQPDLLAMFSATLTSPSSRSQISISPKLLDGVSFAG